MKTSEILRKGKAVIELEDNWTQRWLARDMHGKETSPHKADAWQFDSFGALTVVQNLYHLQDVQKAFFYLSQAMGNRIMTYNDTHTHKEVMFAWDMAVQIAERDND